MYRLDQLPHADVGEKYVVRSSLFLQLVVGPLERLILDPCMRSSLDVMKPNSTRGQ